MDLQLAKESELYNYNHYNYQVILFITALTAFIIIAIDYIQLKRLVNKETQSNYKILCEIKEINKKLFSSTVVCSQLETKIGNINKTINSALEQQMDYINRQLLTQNASIEDVNVKLFHDAEESRAFVSRQISDINSKLFERMEEIQSDISNQVKELEEKQTLVESKMETIQNDVVYKIEEKFALDKKIVYDMYCYLKNSVTLDSSLQDTVRGFFAYFYNFSYNPTVRSDFCMAVQDSHPYHLRRAGIVEESNWDTLLQRRVSK